MDSQIAQVLSGSAYIQQGDSALQGAESPAVQQHVQGGAEMVSESNQYALGVGGPPQQHSSMSEGVASVAADAGEGPLEGVGEVLADVGAGMGESSDLGGSNYLGEQHASHHLCSQQPHRAQHSQQHASHHHHHHHGHQQHHHEEGGGEGSTLSGHGKRKSRGSEMGEVADTDDLGGRRSGEEVQGGGPAASRPAPSDACDSNAMPPLLCDAAQQAKHASGLGDQPTDAEILAWQNQIMASEGQDQPLVGDREPLQALAAEYATGSRVFVQKIQKLQGSYGSIRRSRGDGNCFYRSFFFGYLEHLITTHDEAERDRVLKRLEGLKQALLDSGYEELVFEGPLDMMLQMLRAVDSPIEPLTIAALESNMRSGDIGNYVLFMLRMLTTCEIKARAEFFAPFILGMSDMDVDSFCSRCVDPMGEESDHVQLVALTDALEVPIRVVYLDRSMGGESGGGAGQEGEVHVDMHDFVPENMAGAGALPRVHLLYRPGHYDILYPL